MKATYDGAPLELTERFQAALRELVRAELEMMRNHDRSFADCWTWGVVTIQDLATADGLEFEFGGDNDRPTWLKGDAGIRCPNEAVG